MGGCGGGEEAFPGAAGVAVEFGEFSGNAAFGGAGGRGGEGLGGDGQAGAVFVGVGFAGALGFAGAAAAAFALSGGVVAAVVDFAAGPQAGAVAGGAGGEVALGGVGADGAGVDAEDLRDVVGGQQVVGVLALGQGGDGPAFQVGVGLGEVVEEVAAFGEQVGDVFAEGGGVPPVPGEERDAGVGRNGTSPMDTASVWRCSTR